MRPGEPRPAARPRPAPSGMAGAVVGRDRLVVIGASWGGLAAVSAILRSLPDDVGAPLVVVQHRAKESDSLLADLLQACTWRPVRDVEDKEPLEPATVFLAPPDYHLLVEDGYLSLTTDAAVRYSRPSIDVTLASAADAVGARAVGVVCTGANDDGARGVRHLVDRGGRAVVQDPATAEVRTMPEAAARALAGAPRDRWSVAPLGAIGARIAAAVGSVLVAGSVGVPS